MAEDRKDIGALIKERLAEAQMEPHPTVWEKIHLSLKQNKRIRLFWWSAGVLSMVALGLFLFFHFSKNAPDTDSNGNNPTHQPAFENQKSTDGPTHVKIDSSAVVKIGEPRELIVKPGARQSNNTVTEKNKTSHKYEIHSDKNPEYRAQESNTKDSRIQSLQKTVPQNTSSLQEEKIDSVSNDSTQIAPDRQRKVLTDTKDSLKTEEQEISKWHLTVQGGLSRSGFLTTSNDFMSHPLEGNGNGEYSAGYRFYVNLMVNDETSLRLGVSQLKFQYVITSTNAHGYARNSTALFNAPPTTIRDDVNNNEELTYRHTIKYLQFPFEVKKKVNSLSKGNLHFYVVPGVDFLFMQSDYIDLKTPN
ncbi:MAG: hypothetical protein AB3N16_01895, partial [Flavobacteriaceae bacterium]